MERETALVHQVVEANAFPVCDSSEIACGRVVNLRQEQRGGALLLFLAPVALINQPRLALRRSYGAIRRCSTQTAAIQVLATLQPPNGPMPECTGIRGGG